MVKRNLLRILTLVLVMALLLTSLPGADARGQKKKKRPVFIAIGRNEKRVWRLYLLVLLDDEILKNPC